MYNRYRFSFVLIMTVLFIGLISWTYHDFSQTLNTYTEDSVSTITALQDVLNAVHEQDAALYRILVTQDQSQNLSLDAENDVISNLFSLRSSPQFSSERISSRVNELLELQQLRSEIIAQHQTNLISTQSKGEERLEILLEQYEHTRQSVLDRINQDISLLREQQLTLQQQLDSSLFREILAIGFLYLLTLSGSFLIERRYSGTVASDFLTSEHRRLLDWIQDQSQRGQYPTLKEVREQFGYTHPTVVRKIREIEEKNGLRIQKRGRSKYLVPR